MLVDFVDLNEKEQSLVFLARSQANAFLSYKNGDFKSFLNFLKYLKFQNDKKYFMLLENDDFIGVISFYNIKNSSAQIGFYKNPKRQKVGKIIINELLKKAKNLGLFHIYARVQKTNFKALKLFEFSEFKQISSLNDDILEFEKNI